MEIPANSIARIITADLMGTKAIEIVFSSEQEFLNSGDILIGEVEVGMMEEIIAQLMPMKDRVENLIDVLDTFVTSVNAMFTDDAQNMIQSSIRNLDASLRNIRTMTTAANQIVHEEQKNIERILANFAKISEELTEANLPTTLNSLQSTLAQTEQLIRNLHEGEGTTGLLLNDPKLYEELTNSAASLSRLLDDLQANPRRYVQFSLFGRNSN
jgi:phospholipid/cholesterol/gamma-HCH transport system substrate-binding protein